MKQNRLQKEKIVSVHPVFYDTLSRHYDGYKVKNELIPYDKTNNGVKAYLSKNASQVDSFEKLEDWSRIAQRIENKKTKKYVPIKVAPLSEFGYIKLTDNQVIFYGIMGTPTLIDLTNNKVYYK
jgi:hypothetical protein